MKFTIEPMGLGEILSRAFSLLFTRLGMFLAIEVIIVSPTLILQLVLPDIAVGPAAMVLVLPMIILQPIGSAAMLHVITQEYLGHSVSLGAAFQFALQRFLPLLGTSILATLGIAVGLMACCIPGIYLAIAWAFISQVVVMENIAGPAALGRSSELVKGYWGHVFAVFFVVGLVIGIPNAVVTIGLGFALPFQNLDPNNPLLRVGPVTNFRNFAIVEVTTTAVNGMVQAFYAICATLVYFDLRNRKEAFDVGHIVAWMDKYRTLSDEPMPDLPPAGGAGTPETGIKPSGTVPPPETGFQDPNTPRTDNEPRPPQ